MTFASRIARNRRHMLVLTLAAMVNLWLVTSFGVLLVMLRFGRNLAGMNPGLFFGGALFVGAIAAIAFTRDRMRKTPGRTLLSIDAQPVQPSQVRQLGNLVAELSIAMGIPQPRLALVDNAAPNALAVGRTPETTTVAVTTGLLATLSRNDLEAVLAVVWCAIAIRDVAVGTVASACLAETAARLGLETRGRRRRGKRDPVWEILTVPSRAATRRLQLAINRDRGESADILAMQITKNPMALLRALAKLEENQGTIRASGSVDRDLWFVDSNPRSDHQTRVGIPARMRAIEAAFGIRLAAQAPIDPTDTGRSRLMPSS